MTRIFEESRGITRWQIEDKDPPLMLPWGYVYPPGTVMIDDPTTRDNCHSIMGTSTGRVFSIINPNGTSIDVIYCEIMEPGSEFVPSRPPMYKWTARCPHRKVVGR